MGRRKIEIEMVKDPNTRQVTFSKRRTGLFKKANELTILCGAEVAIVVFSPGNKPYSFGHPGVDVVAANYLQQENIPNDSQENSSSSDAPNMENLNQELAEVLAEIRESEKQAAKHDEILKKNNVKKLSELAELKDSYKQFHDIVKLRLSDLEISEYMMLLARDPVVGVKAKSAKRKRGKN
ncbi:agamous-like MADS-box protein AGL29 [Vicia villosa]|uniref:agamous-like MADS-box protein AGL29 n=1 Tax=Vicia villosa TaxID=3911 RepID=UPI00273BDFBD|nr:agamous-like MADS-box protein AGL29 [Vicia villosa]XP_058735897.1 agamous-like MADS-box protein AGL29 [Vicia villosa]